MLYIRVTRLCLILRSVELYAFSISAYIFINEGKGGNGPRMCAKYVN